MKYRAIAMLTLAFLALPVAAFAGTFSCSIPLPRETPDSTLPDLAKISLTQAQKIAVDSIKTPSKKIPRGALEVEQGCLLYTFDIWSVGKLGIDEVMIDAGTGEILLHRHEAPKP